MKNCTPHRETLYPQARRRHVGLRAWVGSTIAVIVLALLWVQPVAAQAIGPVYALPGTLSRAVNRSYDTIMTTANGVQYGLAGQTPDIEAQIVQFRSQGDALEIKVWGDRYPAAVENDLEIIIVSSIQPAAPEPEATVAPTTAPTVAPTTAPTPVATPAVPIAVVTAVTVNVRSGPGTDYALVGSLVAGQTCAIIGRNQSATWWQLSCPGATSGWVFGELLALAGPVSTVPVAQTAPPPTPVPPATFASWKSSFFANRDLSGNPVLTNDQPRLAFSWGAGSPGANVPSDNFSARFERTLDFAFGTYELSLTVDDGARVFIDDQLVMDNWSVGSARSQTVRQVLSGSRRFRIEYFEATGDAALYFGANLVSSSEAWQATYYNGKGFASTPILTRGEPRSGSYQLDYNWGRGSPGSGVPVDLFSVRWVGTFNFENGDYRFSATTDDGIRVYIDGILILDKWLNGRYDVNNTFRGLGAGNHQIVVEYYEDYGDAVMRLGWERVNSSGGGGNDGGDSGRPRDE